MLSHNKRRQTCILCCVPKYPGHDRRQHYKDTCLYIKLVLTQFRWEWHSSWVSWVNILIHHLSWSLKTSFEFKWLPTQALYIFVSKGSGSMRWYISWYGALVRNRRENLIPGGSWEELPKEQGEHFLAPLCLSCLLFFSHSLLCFGPSFHRFLCKGIINNGRTSP